MWLSHEYANAAVLCNIIVWTEVATHEIMYLYEKFLNDLSAVCLSIKFWIETNNSFCLMIVWKLICWLEWNISFCMKNDMLNMNDSFCTKFGLYRNDLNNYQKLLILYEKWCVEWIVTTHSVWKMICWIGTTCFEVSKSLSTRWFSALACSSFVYISMNV